MTGIAIVGTGMWAPRLAAAAQRAGLEIVTCHSRSEEKRTAFAERFGCAAAASLEEAIGHPDVEGVVLATPNDTHEEQALACAARGRHVFVEKPIADTLEAGERMRDACADAGVALMVGHAFRRLGAARRTRELIDAGRARRGRARRGEHVAAGQLQARRLARASARATRAGRSCSSASTTSTRSPTGSARSRARAARFAHVHADADIDDVGVVTLEFRSGALGVVTGSYVSPKTLSLRLFGSEGVLDYRTDFSVWPDAPGARRRHRADPERRAGRVRERDMLAEELAEFGACIRGEAAIETGRRPRASPRSAACSKRSASGARRSPDARRRRRGGRLAAAAAGVGARRRAGRARR